MWGTLIKSVVSGALSSIIDGLVGWFKSERAAADRQALAAAQFRLEGLRERNQLERRLAQAAMIPVADGDKQTTLSERLRSL